MRTWPLARLHQADVPIGAGTERVLACAQEWTHSRIWIQAREPSTRLASFQHHASRFSVAELPRRDDRRRCCISASLLNTESQQERRANKPSCPRWSQHRVATIAPASRLGCRGRFLTFRIEIHLLFKFFMRGKEFFT